MKVRWLDHIHIHCSNTGESKRFYTEVLQAEPIGQALSGRGEMMEFVRLGGLTLVLAPFPPGMEPAVPPPYAIGAYGHGFGVAHFGLSVEDLDEAVESVRRLGGKILAEPKENAGLRYAYVGAPDGVIVELLQHGGKWAALLGPPRPT